MSKKSKFAREKRIERQRSEEGLANRAALRHAMSHASTAKEKADASMKLQKRKVNESPCRSVRRCQFCGRTKGVLRFFKLCRLCLREAADKGLMPGLRKSSW